MIVRDAGYEVLPAATAAEALDLRHSVAPAARSSTSSGDDPRHIRTEPGVGYRFMS